MIHSRSILLLCLIVLSCNKHQTALIATRDNNVCKKLSGKVILYAVFVDAKNAQPWSDYDIKSTLDSIHRATAWVEEQAKESNVPLSIEVVYHDNKGVVPIAADFPNKTLSQTLFVPSTMVGIPRIDKWADKIAKVAGKSFPKDTTSRTKTKNKLSDRERIVARLRDIHKTDNVVLMYFINNYYKEEISVSIHCASFDEIEYSIVSFKKPAVIAHEFLHIFGAWDLYVSPFDKKKKNQKRKQLAMKEFPDEIMAFAYRDIDSLRISPFSKYLIGWDKKLDDKYTQLFFGKKIHLIHY